MKFIKSLLLVGAVFGASTGIIIDRPVVAQEAAPVASTKITEEQLGQMLTAIGLEAEKKEQRYDFAFRATVAEQEWELSMSAVLSQDGESLWVMAWLDNLPKSSNEVPRTALLRLLAQNDQLGNGKFFAYVPANRRFVLERTVANENMTSAKLRLILSDLGSSVVDTYPIWAVTNWNPTGIPSAPVGTTSTTTTDPNTQSAANDSKFEQPVRR